MWGQLTVCVAVFAAVFVRTSEATSTFCVAPSEPLGTEVSDGAGQCLEIKTWNEYLAEQTRYFTGVSDTRFYFYPGIHYMNRSLEAVYVTDLQICGNAPNNVLITFAIIDLSIRMTFTNFSNILIQGISIKQCAPIAPATYNDGLLHFSLGENATVYTVSYVLSTYR